MAERIEHNYEQKHFSQAFVLSLKVFFLSQPLRPSYIRLSRQTCSVTRKKSPIVYKSCPKMISLENE